MSGFHYLHHVPLDLRIKFVNYLLIFLALNFSKSRLLVLEQSDFLLAILCLIYLFGKVDLDVLHLLVFLGHLFGHLRDALLKLLGQSLLHARLMLTL